MIGVMQGNGAHFEIHKREDGRWGWRLREGQDILATDGGSGYEDRSECIEIGEAVIGGYYSSTMMTIVSPDDD